MSEIDKDLQRRLKSFAEGISPEPERSALVVRSARRKRRLVALSAGLAIVVAIGGLAGAATLLGDRGGIKPAPGPEETSECVSAGYDAAVFIEDAATEPQIQRLRQSLTADAEVESVTFMSKQAAFEEFKEYYADQPEFWENLPEDALPMSFRVTLRDDADLDAAARRFKSLEHVEAVRTRGELSKDRAPGAGMPGCPSNTFARYSFEVAEGEASASGVLEVSSEEPSICLSLTSDNIIASHLLIKDLDNPRKRSILFTFFDPNDAEEGRDVRFSQQCFNEEQLDIHPAELQLLIDEPERFVIDFHRGPQDEPGLVADLVPVGDEEGSSDPLEASIEAQGGTIRLRVVPIKLNGAQVMRLVLTNATTGRIGVGGSNLLESKTPQGWIEIERPPNCEATLELLLIEPGGSTRDVVGGYDKRCRLAHLASGEYRVTKEVELESGEWVPLSVAFSVAPAAEQEQNWKRLSQPPIRTQGYVFSNLEIRLSGDDDPAVSKMALRGQIGFEDGFPGKRNCRFSLHDSDGEVVGQATSEFMAASPTSGVIKDTIPVEGTPAFAEIECSAKRLDDPDGIFRFRRVTVEPESDTGRFFSVRSRSVSWEGDGDPTPQRCTISVVDSNGELLFKAKSGYIAAGPVPRVVEFRFKAPSWAVDQVADATVDCRSMR